MRLHAETRGTGPPLVLLHGWAMNLRVFDALAAALAADHEVTSVDLPGHGRSPWHTDLTPAAAADALLARVPERATLLGWSLGAQLAMRMAARAPERVGRLVLVCGTPKFTAGGDWPHGLDAAELAAVATGLAREPATTLARFLALQVRGGAAAQATLATLRAALSAHGEAHPVALAAGLEWLAGEDLRPLAGTLALPVLLIAGQNDRVTPPGASRALATLLRQARCVELRRAAHALLLSHHAELLGELRAFLAPRGASGAAA